MSNQFSSSSIRRASEDSRFRAFLSSHFDAQAHVMTVIQEGKSEEVYTDISTCINEVDEEIKNYISLHKHDLMAGMQDVAVLSKRYQTLEATSNRLRLSVDKTSRDTTESYALVRARTLELDRLHHTAVLLRQLRQFLHAKAQLDQYATATSATSNGSSGERDGDLDLRQFATVAKTIQELESLLQCPQLVALRVVAGQVKEIKAFGARLRERAREKLLRALREQDQATVADCLQVFFNLRSLPAIVLLAIDATVKDTLEMSAAALDFNVMCEGGSASSSQGKGRTAVGADVRLLPNSSQLRVAMREMCHDWASRVQEQSVRVHVLQRVIAKKEDPTSHERFSAVLLQGGGGAPVPAHSLVELFWDGLAEALPAVLSDKISMYSSVAPRVYPSLRRATVEVQAAVLVMAAGDKDEGEQSCDESESEAAAFSLYSRGPPVASLFGSTGISTPSIVTPATFGSQRNKRALAVLGSKKQQHRDPSHPSSRGHGNGGRLTPSRSGGGGDPSSEKGLLPALAPLRDQFLAAALSRMTAPVLQMFPEVEGYTAAVPSKRDLQALLRTVQEEVVQCVLEGDRSLVPVVAREALKAVRLLLTKVEGMVSSGSESTRIHLNKDGQFVKTNQQEHNSQLLQLLAQLIDFVDKLPLQIIKATKDSPSSALPRFLSNSGSSGSRGEGEGEGEGESEEAVLRQEMGIFCREATSGAQQLAGRHLLLPLVKALAGHFRRLLLGLLREGVQAHASGGGRSKAVGGVLEQFPRAVDTFLLSSAAQSLALPTPLAVHELCAQLVMAYTSVAALRRPVTEQSRLLTASEISAVDMMVTGLLPPENKHTAHPVLTELRCFRRLLFDPIEQDCRQEKEKKGVLVLGADVECTPSPALVLALPYLPSLRSSTLLAHLLACGPRQLPSLTDSPAAPAPPVGPGSALKSKKKLDPAISDSVSEYVQLVTAALEPPEGQGQGGEDACSGTDADSADKELQLLGASTRQTFMHSSADRNRKNVSPAEMKSIDMARQCLDVFMQRIAVCDEAQKQPLLNWYHALLSICNALSE